MRSSGSTLKREVYRWLFIRVGVRLIRRTQADGAEKLTGGSSAYGEAQELGSIELVELVELVGHWDSANCRVYSCGTGRGCNDFSLIIDRVVVQNCFAMVRLHFSRHRRL
jgi:hypothetical protein